MFLYPGCAICFQSSVRSFYSGLPWAPLGSPRLPWVPLGSLGSFALPWAPWPPLASPGLPWPPLGSLGFSGLQGFYFEEFGARAAQNKILGALGRLPGLTGLPWAPLDSLGSPRLPWAPLGSPGLPELLWPPLGSLASFTV